MKYYILKPKGLDLETRIKKYPPKFKFNLDYAYLIINDIINQTAYQIDRSMRIQETNWETFKQRFQTFFVRMCSRELQAFMREYNKHFDYLYEDIPGDGRVLWKDNYSEGLCFGYQLSKFYYMSDLELYAITDTDLIKKLRKRDKEINRDRSGTGFKVLKRFFSPHKLTIDVVMAIEANNSLYQVTGERHKYFVNAVKIMDIDKGKYFFSHNPDTDGRFHSSITTFPKEFRKFLRYEGKRMAEVDISSSVPFFLYYLLKNLPQKQNLISFSKNLNNIFSTDKSYYYPYMLAIAEYPVDIEEVERFGSSVLAGTFYSDFEADFAKPHSATGREYMEYEYLIEASERMHKRAFDGDVEDYKPVIKMNILAMMNANPTELKIEQAIFKSKYPTINRFLKSFKKRKYDKGIDRHKKFSHLTLQTESYFMVKELPAKIFASFKDRMPFFTLHDCIITTIDMVDTLKSFIEDFFYRETGIVPVLKKKEW